MSPKKSEIPEAAEEPSPIEGGLSHDEEFTQPPAVQKAQHGVGIGFSALLAIIGIVVVLHGVSYGFADEENIIGPGSAPAVLGVLLVLGGIGIGIRDVRSLLNLRTAAADSPSEDADQKVVSSYFVSRIIVPTAIVLIFALGIFLSQYTGILLTVSATVMACALLVERMNWLKAAILGVVTFVLGYLLFDLLLSVRFPDSMIGF